MPHILDISSLSDKDLDYIIGLGSDYYNKKIPDKKIDGIAATLFYEPSTRTRCSFTIAARRLGMEVLNLDMATSSAQKGEDLLDTVSTLYAMGVNVTIIRHPENRVMYSLQDQNNVAIINAGDGTRAHPTQSLGDVLVMQQYLGNLHGKNVVICGDINHSRVARSHLALLPRLGVNVHFVPDNNDDLDLSGQYIRHQKIDDILPQADVIMMLRVQKERMKSMPDLSNYLNTYGLKSGQLVHMKKNAIIMHPGPFNRNIEIDSDIIDHPQCVIAKQVTAGVAIRMAVLSFVMQ